MASHTLQSELLRVVVGDNSSNGEHRSGYNGIWSLEHAAQPGNAFVPLYAGFNLEHIFNGLNTPETESFFEPRLAPMHLQQVDSLTLELHQPPIPLTHVRSVTRFSLRSRDQIDWQFTAIPTQAVWPHDYLGFFWASYIHAPCDKSLHHLGGLGSQSAAAQNRWTQLCTQEHGLHSTVCRRNRTTLFPQATAIPHCLFQSLSPQVWDQPLFYGQTGRMILLAMFEDDPRLRWTHSPSGGGFDAQRQTTNPAWDFQWIIQQPVVGQEYRLRGRIIYRPQMTRPDMLEELNRYHQEIAGM